MKAKATRYPLLDALRAFAVCWVLLFHCRIFEVVPADTFLDGFLLWGHAGVDLFFVLSGFLIGRILLAELNQSGTVDLKGFWARRWLRTLPAYYLVLLVIRVSDVWIAAKGTWGWFPSYFVFLQNYLVPEPMRFGWSWSLCVEEQFYLGLPLLLLALRKMAGKVSPRRLIFGIGLVAAVVSSALRIRFTLEGITSNAFVSHLRLDCLGAGLILAALPASAWASRKLSWGAMWAGAAVVLLLVAQGSSIGPAWYQNQQYLILAFGFGALSFGAIGLPQVSVPSWVRWLAEHSYGLYLLHPLTLRPIVQWGPASPWLRLAAAFGLSLAASYVLRKAVELPALALRDRFFPASRTPVVQTATV